MDEEEFDDPLFNPYTGEYWDDLEPDEEFVSDEDFFPAEIDDEDDFEEWDPESYEDYE